MYLDISINYMIACETCHRVDYQAWDDALSGPGYCR